MENKEHREYIKDLKSLTEKLLKSKKESESFYVSAGIHTKTGRLTHVYNESTTKIGFKTSKDNR